MVHVPHHECPIPMRRLIRRMQQAQQRDAVRPARARHQQACPARQHQRTVKKLIQTLNQPTGRGHNNLMNYPPHRTLSRRWVHWPRIAGAGGLTCIMGLVIASAWADDETLDDLLKNAPPAATAPHEVTGPETSPGHGVVDALGTMKPHAPAGA